jgi:hypothetical protein
MRRCRRFRALPPCDLALIGIAPLGDFRRMLSDNPRLLVQR